MAVCDFGHLRFLSLLDSYSLCRLLEAFVWLVLLLVPEEHLFVQKTLPDTHRIVESS